LSYWPSLQKKYWDEHMAHPIISLLLSSYGYYSIFSYSIILATTPAPTVRPPSRIAKRKPSSIAIGAIRLTTIFTLSPGMTISVPSGKSHAPVTSVVRK